MHLHLHSEYSLLDGSIRISELPARVKEMGMNAVALTDHGAMYGIIQFYKACMKEGIKPILGCEIYVSNNLQDRSKDDNKNYHLVLLAENDAGYKNLMKIVSEGFVNGFYYRPRVSKTFLAEHSYGLIASSACLGGEVSQRILANRYEKAKEAALEYQEIFGKDNFFLEIQDHGIREQSVVNQGLLQIHYETGIPLIATNDAHYLTKEDAEPHDVLLCIQTASTVAEEQRMKFPSQEFYVKSAQEMEVLFRAYPDALSNTQKIADRCQVHLDFDTLHLPAFPIPEGYTETSYLATLIEQGLAKRYGTIDASIKERYEFEFQTIVSMGYTNYFLIVWDFIRFAKSKNIEVGPGRGSAAGSIVSYALEITDIDPLQYGLLFERFLNPERVSMPDIDIDFCYERREEVIQYVIDKYGADHVAQIVTFGTMAARAAIRDVGRALAIPYNRVDQVAKMVPNELGMTLRKALDINPDIKKQMDMDHQVQKMVETALKVEGLPRHTSTHAAGVLIAKEPVTEYVPLTRNGDVITTQYNMTELEELGLLKMDFLGLRTLTVIRDAVDLIKKNHGVVVDFSRMTMDDPQVLKLFEQANTLGIFQFESAGMRAFLKELRPDAFEDLVAANSLFRPGPMNQIPTFIANKHDPSHISYIHESLESILNVTYGCIVYQEQVMQIVRQIGGYSLGRADLVRRAMSKKKMDVMEEERHYFVYGQLDEEGQILVNGAVRNGVDEKAANRIYDLMIDFANYAFNKSHSVAYAVVAYRTAYLKCYYPAEFMAALMSSVMGDEAKIALYMQECSRLRVEVLPPDINQSFAKFTVEQGKIRFGLTAIKSVGAPLIQAIIQTRQDGGEFTSFQDFVERMYSEDRHILNKRAVDRLIKAGTFTNLGHTRAQLLKHYEDLIDSVMNREKNNLAGQFNMFASMEQDTTYVLPEEVEMPKRQILALEKEVSGMYLSGHPLDEYADMLTRVSPMNSIEIRSICEEGGNEQLYNHCYISFAGMISHVRKMLTKKNDMMAFAIVEDLSGTLECVIFPKVYQDFLPLIQEGTLVQVNGRLTFSEVEEPKILVDSITTLEINSKLPRQAREGTEEYANKCQTVYLNVESVRLREVTEMISSTLGKQHGNIQVKLCLQPEAKVLLADSSMWIQPSQVDEKVRQLEVLLGNSNVKLL